MLLALSMRVPIFWFQFIYFSPSLFLVPLSFSSFLSLSLAKASAKLKASHLVVAFKASETSLRKRLAEELRKCCCKKIISEKPDNTWSTFRPPSQRTNKINEKRERKPRRPILWPLNVANLEVKLPVHNSASGLFNYLPWHNRLSNRFLLWQRGKLVWPSWSICN